MKRVLFTAAVEDELLSARIAYNELFNGYKGLDNSNIEIDFITTGIGTTGTSYFLTKALSDSSRKYDFVVNIGLAGSFNDKYPIGSVVRVIKEQFGDLGVESRLGFQTLFEYQILDANTLPFKNGALYSPYLDIEMENGLSSIPSVTGITVQMVSGLSESVERIKNRFSPDIESMEGAAVFYVALMEKVPFIELRSVSNEVGERDKSKWNIPKALDNLKDACKELLRLIVSMQ